MADRVAQARQACIDVINAPESLKEQLVELTQTMVDSLHNGANSAAADAVEVLFEVTTSGYSGTAVNVNAGDASRRPSDASNVAVLVLGYAGSSLQVLRAIERF